MLLPSEVLQAPFAAGCGITAVIEAAGHETSMRIGTCGRRPSEAVHGTVDRPAPGRA
jgi:hypothetical protein